MLKFLNRNGDKELEFQIAMVSEQGGVRVEVDQFNRENEEHVQETILLTPMDAACFVQNVLLTKGVACRPVGHSVTGGGATISIHKILPMEFDEIGTFVGAPSEAIMDVGNVRMTVPTFVTNAMRIAVEHMMASLVYRTAGIMEKEFGYGN